MRYYGFTANEIMTATDAATGMLPLDIDPKLAWALGNRERFPIDINRAPKAAAAHSRSRRVRGEWHPRVAQMARAAAR